LHEGSRLHTPPDCKNLEQSSPKTHLAAIASCALLSDKAKANLV
jgi:hypothetical protein